MPAPFTFALDAVDTATAARAGTFRTPHGEVPTPCFMPVGTRGTVKGLTPDDIDATGATMVLANTFHLALRPGAGTVEALGGLHAVMAWDGPILTDSGGFQAWSLPGTRGHEDGCDLRSPIDGGLIRLTPERVVRLQEALGPDVMMPLDECSPWPCSRALAERGVERTVRWLERSVAARQRDDIALFGIVQGSTHPDLRGECARALAALDLPGYAVGGVSVGEPPAESRPAVRAALAHLPADRPRYLMGIGDPRDLLAAIEDGVDLFDCVLPTRNARNGQVLTARGPVNLRNAAFARDRRPVEDDCPCTACRRFSRGTLRHLFRSNEMLGPILASIHNLTFLAGLLAAARSAIGEGCYGAWKSEALAAYGTR